MQERIVLLLFILSCFLFAQKPPVLDGFKTNNQKNAGLGRLLR